MKTPLEDVRNVTISTKVSAAEKIELQQIANDKKITRSELIYDLLNGYKNHYDYIGRISPKEEKLSTELKKATREVNKLSIELENAEVRLGIEQKEIIKLRDELHRLRNRNIDLNDEIAILKSENDDLQQQITNQEEILDSHNKNKGDITIGSITLGAISGLLLTAIFKK
jgi:chromosome segregation ATPase